MDEAVGSGRDLRGHWCHQLGGITAGWVSRRMHRSGPTPCSRVPGLILNYDVKFTLDEGWQAV